MLIIAGHLRVDPGRVNNLERWASRAAVGAESLEAHVRMWDAVNERDPFDP